MKLTGLREESLFVSFVHHSLSLCPPLFQSLPAILSLHLVNISNTGFKVQGTIKQDRNC